MLRGVVGFIVAAALLSAVGCSHETGSTATARHDRSVSVGVHGIWAEIPMGAVGRDVTLTAAILDSVPAAMRAGVTIVGNVYEISGYDGRFREPVAITLSYDPAAVPRGGCVYPAYWNGETWIAMPGDVRDAEITVYANHLSFWTVLFVLDEGAWDTNPILSAIKEACGVVFWSDDLWAEKRWEVMEEFVESYLQSCPVMEQLEATGPPIDEAIVAGTTYRIVPTNLPKLTSLMDGEYSETEAELWVQDESGEWVEDKEIAFKALFVHEYRGVFTQVRIGETTERCEELVEILSKYSILHGVGSAIDLTHSVLSEVLSHYVTQTPYSPAELLRGDYLLAVEGLVCRADTRRYIEELQDLPEKLEHYDPSRTTYEELSELCARCVDCWDRFEPVHEYLKATFPGYEENIALYTLKKVGRDFVGAFLAHGHRVYSGKAVDQRFTPDHAKHFAEVAAWMSAAQVGESTVAASEVLFHAIGLLDGNPLAEYYESVHSLEYLPLSCVASVEYVTRSFRTRSASGAAMVLVPAGAFTMGDSRCPEHSAAWEECEVTLAHDFYLGQHEVTNQQYLETVQWAHDRGYVTVTASSIRDNLDGSTAELMYLDLEHCEIQFDGSGRFYLRGLLSDEARDVSLSD